MQLIEMSKINQSILPKISDGSFQNCFLDFMLCRVDAKYILCTVRNTVQTDDKGQWAS